MAYKQPDSILDYSIIKELGKGSFGVVFLARDSSKQKVAIKCIEWQQKYTQREMDIALQLEPSDYTVPVLELFQYDYHNKEFYCIVMEFCDGGNLNNHIIHERPPRDRVVGYMVDLAKGVRHLHDHKVIHRDLKAENVLLCRQGSRWRCKVGDFSIAKLQTGSRFVETKFGHFYEAPEVAERPIYTYSADIYSLGLLYFVMHVQDHVTEDGEEILAPYMEDGKGRVRSITTCVRAGLDKDRFKSRYFSTLPRLGALVCGMLEYEPTNRPYIGKILEEIQEICEENKTEKQEKPKITERRSTRKTDETLVSPPVPKPRPRRGKDVTDYHQNPTQGIDVTKIKDTFQIMGHNRLGAVEISDDSDEDVMQHQTVIRRPEYEEAQRDRHRNRQPDRQPDRHRDKDKDMRSRMEDLDIKQHRQHREPVHKGHHKLPPTGGFANLKDTFQLQKEKSHLFPRKHKDDDEEF